MFNLCRYYRNVKLSSVKKKVLQLVAKLVYLMLATMQGDLDCNRRVGGLCLLHYMRLNLAIIMLK